MGYCGHQPVMTGLVIKGAQTARLRTQVDEDAPRFGLKGGVGDEDTLQTAITFFLVASGTAQTHAEVSHSNKLYFTPGHTPNSSSFNTS
jgi:hypothetical protein